MTKGRDGRQHNTSEVEKKGQYGQNREHRGQRCAARLKKQALQGLAIQIKSLQSQRNRNSKVRRRGREDDQIYGYFYTFLNQKNIK